MDWKALMLDQWPDHVHPTAAAGKNLLAPHRDAGRSLVGFA
jgi:hypothetical protein